MRIDQDRGLLLCVHCGSQQEASPAIAYLEVLDPTSWRCPVCSGFLSSARLEGYSVHCCPACSGMLIAMDRFAAVIDAARTHDARAFRTALPRQQNPAHRTLACPICGQSMIGHLYAGPGNVVIDTCERCQVNWLDPGELHRITVAPDSRPDRES